MTNRFAAANFAAVMFWCIILRYQQWDVATDWVNDGGIRDGWHLFGIGTADYEEDMNTYAEQYVFTG